MDLSIWLAVIGLAVAVVAIIASVWATKKYGERRGRILVTCDFTPLITRVDSSGSADLQVTYKDIPVPDPFVSTITLSNIGPKDIATSYFDSGRNLSLDLNCKMYGLLAINAPNGAVESRAIGGAAVIEFRPNLLKKGESWSVDIVVSGRPAMSIESPLIDVDVMSGPLRDKEFMGNVARSMFDAVAPGPIVILANGLTGFMKGGK